MPYQSSGGRRNSVQFGAGRSVWAGAPPPPIPERILDGIPGCLAWVALLFCVASAIAFPRTLLLVAALLAFYSAVRFLLAGIANITGQRHINHWEQTDWHMRYLEEFADDALDWNDIHHVAIIPNYREPVEILRYTLDNLANEYQASRRLTVVLAMEATEDGCVEKAEHLSKRYSSRFANFFYTIHPGGLPGELRGKSANEAWAARWVKRRLVDEMGYGIDNITITTMDADTLWHPHYFYALTYLFAINPDRHKRFWQAPIRYHGNIWEINPLLRLVNAYSTAFELAYLAASWWLPMPISSYTLSLRLLEASGYWDADVMAEDWHMFIKAFFARNAEVTVEPIFLPFLAHATTGETLREAIKNRYLQSLRHAWGSKEVGYIVAKMLEHPEMEFMPNLHLLYRVAHDILLAGAGWVILTVGSQLPLLVHPQVLSEMLADGLRNPTFMLLQASFLTFLILSMVFWYLDVRVRPPRTRRQTLVERVLTLVSFPLLPVLTLIFVAIPVLQAQTRLLVGISLQYRVARKL